MIFTKSYWGSGSNTLSEIRRALAGILSAYSSILFVDHPLIGILFLGATFWFPNVGIAGLIGAAIGMTVGYVLRLPYSTSGVNVYSSLLVGLSLGAYYELDAGLLTLIALSSAMTVLLAAALRDFLWRLGQLPVLSLPFVLVALTAALAARAYGGLSPYYAPSLLPPAVFSGWADSFLASLGSTFFSSHPLVGALLFIGILLRSRYLAFLCLAGFLSGQLVFTMLAADLTPGLLEWTGFNFALTAMALGGIFTVPSFATFLVAVVAAGASAVVTAALSQYLLVYSLPVMALPFLLTTLTFLAAFRLRISASPPILLLENPGLPETNFERARLAETRLGSLGSVPLLAPFLGEWQVYQGFDGKHTHRDQWRFALDFHRVEEGQSFSADGASLERYFCFGLPVLSPAFGLIVSVKDSLPDNSPGELDLRNNWGNHVLIQTDSGMFVLLAHLKQFSVTVREGERVTPNTPIARCGNSGRSPQPHLHLQVQRHSSLGGATVPFHLVSSIVRPDGGTPEYRLVAELAEGSSVQRAEEDHPLASALNLPVGRILKYRLTDYDGSTTEQTMCVEVTLLGQYRLTTENGANAAFEHRNGTLGFYDRSGPANPFLDLWLLALGLTPLSTLAQSWEDAPSTQLLPLGRWARLILAIRRPLGCAVESHYRRDWSAAEQVWMQRGRHELRIPGMRRQASTYVSMSPTYGCTDVGLEYQGRKMHAVLIAVGQVADRGVPPWQQDIPSNSQQSDPQEQKI